jgi:hypothetical protein
MARINEITEEVLNPMAIMLAYKKVRALNACTYSIDPRAVM